MAQCIRIIIHPIHAHDPITCTRSHHILIYRPLGICKQSRAILIYFSFFSFFGTSIIIFRFYFFYFSISCVHHLDLKSIRLSHFILEKSDTSPNSMFYPLLCLNFLNMFHSSYGFENSHRRTLHLYEKNYEF